jgi:hypothetical protein
MECSQTWPLICVWRWLRQAAGQWLYCFARRGGGDTVPQGLQTFPGFVDPTKSTEQPWIVHYFNFCYPLDGTQKTQRPYLCSGKEVKEWGNSVIHCLRPYEMCEVSCLLRCFKGIPISHGPCLNNTLILQDLISTFERFYIDVYLLGRTVHLNYLCRLCRLFRGLRPANWEGCKRQLWLNLK